jgi:NitT/TauT family transport system substrate-binding protein
MMLARTAAIVPLLWAVAAPAAEKVVFGTNWLAQAEHGGFYQALADGTYEACGLEVEILSGGPQVNGRALMMAGKIDFYMGGNTLAALNAVAQGVPVVIVAAMFQKDPQVILSHPGEADTWEELKDLTLLISDTGFASYYQWMISAHGFTAEQREPYTFNPAPFIADPRKGMQGYLSSEPYAIRREAGWAPNVFLIADHGYDDYSTTIEAMADTIADRPQAVACFVDGSVKGWYGYLYGDRSAADALIIEANPDMTQDRLDYAVESMKSEGIVDSGDALDFGIGALSAARIGDFYSGMVAAGVAAEGIDWRAAFTTDFVNRGVGMDLKPAD